MAGVKVSATNEATGVKFDDSLGLGWRVPLPAVADRYLYGQRFGQWLQVFTAKGIVLNVDQEYVATVKLRSARPQRLSKWRPRPSRSIPPTFSSATSSTRPDGGATPDRPQFTGLELVLPGVQASSDRFGSFSVSGGQTQQSEYLINGADTNDIALNTVALSPNLDAIDQFNLIDGPLNAEYDRNSGGIVSATIKEGTNHFHGDAFEFYRDTFLNTLSYFQKSATTGTGVVQPYHQHIFGGTVGGPIFHDKLFFYGAYNGTRQRVPDGSGNVSVYTANNLGGNFSAEDNGTGARPTATQSWGNFFPNAIPASISIPGCSTAGETWAQCAYDLGGVFPTSSFNSIATSLVKSTSLRRTAEPTAISSTRLPKQPKTSTSVASTTPSTPQTRSQRSASTTGVW